MDKITDRRTKPFFMTENRLVDEGHIARMGVPSHAIYTCLCRHANTEHQCFPSYGKLEEETGLARATVWAALSKLIHMGYIRKLSIKRKQANIYEIMDLPTYNKDSDGIEEHPSSSGNELVQQMNQFNKRTTTSSIDEPPLVQQMNSKNTNGNIHNEKNSINQSGNSKTKSQDDGLIDLNISFPIPISHSSGSASLEDEKGSAADPRTNALADILEKCDGDRTRWGNFFDWADLNLWPTFSQPIKNQSAWLRSIDKNSGLSRLELNYPTFLASLRAPTRSTEAEWQKVLKLAATMQYGGKTTDRINPYEDPALYHAVMAAGGLSLIGSSDFSSLSIYKSKFFEAFNHAIETC